MQEYSTELVKRDTARFLSDCFFMARVSCFEKYYYIPVIALNKISAFDKAHEYAKKEFNDQFKSIVIYPTLNAIEETIK